MKILCSKLLMLSNKNMVSPIILGYKLKLQNVLISQVDNGYVLVCGCEFVVVSWKKIIMQARYISLFFFNMNFNFLAK